MEKKTKQKYLQMCIGTSQNPICFKLLKDNKIEISFNQKSKNTNQRHQAWIPPPGKTAKRTRHNCSDNKYSKNQIIISMPEDGTIISPSDHPFQIGSCNNPNIQAHFQPKSILDQTSSVSNDEILPVQENQAQQMKDNLNMQERFLGEAERFLKVHENKQKVLSKYCHALKKNMQDINKSINELESQENKLLKTKSKHKMEKVHYQDEDVEELKKLLYAKKLRRNLFKDQDKEDSKNQDEKDDLDTYGDKTNLRWVKSIEDVSKLYLPRVQPIRTDSRERNGKTLNTNTEVKQLPESTEKCVTTENLMMKLADNMRKTKMLIDAVCHEDEIIDSMQKKYHISVERLYKEQNSLLDELYQTLDIVNSSDIIEGTLDESRESSSMQTENRRAKKDTTKQDYSDFDPAQSKAGERKNYIFKRTSTPNLYIQSEMERRDKANDDKQTSRPENESERISRNREPVRKSSSDKDIHDKTKSSSPDSLKDDGYTCETIIKEIVKRFPSKLMDEVNNINASKGNDLKSDGYDCEIEIKQKLRCPPLKVEDRTSKIYTTQPITDLLKDIDKAIDQLTLSCSYTLSGEDKIDVEEGSLIDDTFRTIPESSYKHDSTEHDESVQDTESFAEKTKTVKYDKKTNKEHREKTKQKKLQTFTARTIPFQHTLLKRTELKHDGTQTDSIQSFTQIAALEKCNCSGSCTNVNHYDSSFELPDSPREETNKSKKNRTIDDTSQYKPLEGSIDDSESQTNYKSRGTQTDLSESSSESLKSEKISQSDLHSRITKHSEKNNTKDMSIQVAVLSQTDKNNQSAMNEFLYRLPSTSKEITDLPLRTSTPKKIAQYQFRNPEESSENENIPGTSNIENARNKINSLYVDIMKRF
ncbi:uncharacterized protein TNIN_45541 [Trichonephila inaurata madagascariensis]|uniref:Uncharacterized protein n=1 Tax=Trichonephila inaurata madagascariensis TaxID=2747483 RepID=A0A8X6XS35_9ARAC|nr:uncharacterized protein TNIN_45541 [Trichonephila inaurata madagascariensis]